jgi:hypothetical protein
MSNSDCNNHHPSNSPNDTRNPLEIFEEIIDQQLQESLFSQRQQQEASVVADSTENNNHNHNTTTESTITSIQTETNTMGNVDSSNGADNTAGATVSSSFPLQVHEQEPVPSRTSNAATAAAAAAAAPVSNDNVAANNNDMVEDEASASQIGERPNNIDLALDDFEFLRALANGDVDDDDFLRTLANGRVDDDDDDDDDSDGDGDSDEDDDVDSVTYLAPRQERPGNSDIHNSTNTGTRRILRANLSADVPTAAVRIGTDDTTIAATNNNPNEDDEEHAGPPPLSSRRSANDGDSSDDEGNGDSDGDYHEEGEEDDDDNYDDDDYGEDDDDDDSEANDSFLRHVAQQYDDMDTNENVFIVPAGVDLNMLTDRTREELAGVPPFMRNAVLERMVESAMNQFFNMAGESAEERRMKERTVKCPVCSEAYLDYKEGDHPNRIAARKTPQHCCSHGATMLFIKLDSCPICMEEHLEPPAVALACGHVICKEDFEKLGGIVGQRPADKPEPMALPNGTDTSTTPSGTDTSTTPGTRSRNRPAQRGFLNAPRNPPPSSESTRNRASFSFGPYGNMHLPPAFRQSNPFAEIAADIAGRFDEDDDDDADDDNTDDEMPPLITRDRNDDSDGSGSSSGSLPGLVNRNRSRRSDDDESMPPLMTREEIRENEEAQRLERVEPIRRRVEERSNTLFSEDGEPPPLQTQSSSSNNGPPPLETRNSATSRNLDSATSDRINATASNSSTNNSRNGPMPSPGFVNPPPGIFFAPDMHGEGAQGPMPLPSSLARALMAGLRAHIMTEDGQYDISDIDDDDDGEDDTSDIELVD